MTLRWVPGWNGLTEPEAVSYVAAVEVADGQELEFGVARAINDFVTGCKQDKIWDAIKASCILAGARTLDGALVPLVGGAPTNNFFVDADYDRETGLVGDGSTKYLNSNRNNNADPQNSKHVAVYSTSNVNQGQAWLAARTSVADNSGQTSITSAPSGTVDFRVNTHNAFSTVSQVGFSGFKGSSRSSESLTTARIQGNNYTSLEASEAPSSASIFVFSRNTGGSADTYSPARIAFYSIGESLDLAALDTRVSNLITAIGAAIP